MLRSGGKHNPYREDPRKAHDGTLEFTSCDAHKGVPPSRRADLEIMSYVMLQWVSELPWQKLCASKGPHSKATCEKVMKMKMQYNKVVLLALISSFNAFIVFRWQGNECKCR